MDMESFDAHNHLQKGPSGPICQDLALKKTGAAVNSTCEKDWVEVEDLAAQYPHVVVPGFGIHPWWADSALGETWSQRLESLLQKYPGAFIGEAGLDGYRANRPKGPGFSSQIKILIPQLTLASQMERPIVLHCVKAWDELRDQLLQAKVRHFAIHRFKGNPEMALEIVKMGGYLSIHLDTLYHYPSSSCVDSVPKTRILLETDYDGPRIDGKHIPDELQELYNRLALVWRLDPRDVMTLAYQNARNFYRF